MAASNDEEEEGDFERDDDQTELENVENDDEEGGNKVKNHTIIKRSKNQVNVSVKIYTKKGKNKKKKKGKKKSKKRKSRACSKNESQQLAGCFVRLHWSIINTNYRNRWCDVGTEQTWAFRRAMH